MEIIPFQTKRTQAIHDILLRVSLITWVIQNIKFYNLQ